MTEEQPRTDEVSDMETSDDPGPTAADLDLMVRLRDALRDLPA